MSVHVVDEVDKNEFKVHFKDFSKRTSYFIDNVKHFVSDVKEVLVNQFIEFIPMKSLEYVYFDEKRNKLESEFQCIQTLVENISEKSSLSSVKFKALYEDFTLTGKKLKFVVALGLCARDLEVSKRLIERCQYNEAANILDKLLNILENSNMSGFEALVNSMIDLVSFNHVKCLYKITEQWRSRLKWSEGFTNKGHIITVEINVSDPENLQDILNALSSSKRIDVELARFSNFVIKSVMPALLTRSSVINVKQTLHNVILEIEYSDDSKKCEDIKVVLKNLVTFFGTIQSNIDCRWEDNRTVFLILGQLLGKDFFEMLKEYCLQNLITIDEEKIETYLPIATEIEKFSEYLCEINFTDKNSSPLSEFLRDTHKLICDRRCKVLLVSAKKLMETNLQQDIVEVSVNECSDICLDEIKMLEKDLQERNITDSPYLLPRCSISLSAKKIFQLLIEQLNVAHNSSPVMANQILTVVRNILELYIALVPDIHADELKNNPLDLALFYNNCFYLAHGMLGNPWSAVFHQEFSTNLNIILSDLVQNFRRVAIVKLATFIKEQKQFIVDIIEQSEISNLSKADSSEIDSCTAVNKCLELFKKLHRLWKPVLPQAVYEKTMTNLISCFSEELVQAVLTVKDNAVKDDVIMSIVNVYKSLIAVVPCLFDESFTADKMPKKWLRFVELTSLLECQMFSIASRWNDPNKKLSSLFSVDEITNLIRTLFPHNKRKVAVLEMIK